MTEVLQLLQLASYMLATVEAKTPVQADATQ